MRLETKRRSDCIVNFDYWRARARSRGERRTDFAGDYASSACGTYTFYEQLSRSLPRVISAASSGIFRARDNAKSLQILRTFSRNFFAV